MNDLTGARAATVTSASRQSIQVLLFGVLRERLGTPTVTVSQPANTVADIWEIVMARHWGNVQLHDAVLCARNLEYCTWDTKVVPGDEIAFMPPVSGGSSDGDAGVTVAVAEHPISVAELLAHAGVDEDGAVACFFGRVRNRSEGAGVSALDYETYAPMALSLMRRIALDAKSRYGLSTIAIVHRAGALSVGDIAVAVITSSPHRAQALDACRAAIDAVKAQVPIWKREHTAAGAQWVDARHMSETHG